MTDLKETLCGIAKAIVDSPDEVTVAEAVDGKRVNLTLSVAEDDMGMVWLSVSTARLQRQFAQL